MIDSRESIFAEVNKLIKEGFDQKRFATLLNAGPHILSDQIWSYLEDQELSADWGYHERQATAHLMVEIDLARRLYFVRRKTEPSIASPYDAQRTAGIFAWNKANQLDIAAPETVIWLQAAAHFLEETGEHHLLTICLQALSNSLQASVYGDVADNLRDAIKALRKAAKILQFMLAQPFDENVTTEELSTRLANAFFAEAMLTHRQMRTNGKNREAIIDLVAKTIDLARRWGLSELREEAFSFAMLADIFTEIEILCGAGTRSDGNGAPDQTALQTLIQEALLAPPLGEKRYQETIATIDRALSEQDEQSELTNADLWLLRAQVTLKHGPLEPADQAAVALLDVDRSLAHAVGTTRRDLLKHIAARRLRAVVLSELRRNEDSLAELETLVTEIAQLASRAKTPIGIRSQAEQLRAIGSVAVRTAVKTADPGRGLALADASRTMSVINTRLSTVASFELLSNDALSQIPPEHGVIVSMVPTEEGLFLYLTSRQRQSYVPEQTMRIVSQGTHDVFSDLSKRWRHAYQGIMLTFEQQGRVSDQSWNSASNVLADILSRLEHLVAHPIADLLEISGIKHISRIVLVPHGILASLPVHAAASLPESHWVSSFDPYVLSYAPNILYLARQKERGSDRATLGSARIALGIFNPTDDLADAELEELDAFKTSMGTAGNTKLLKGRSASLAAFRDYAGGANIVHFAGHGNFNSEQPGLSGLMLADGSLSIDDITSDYQFAACRLAFLSACETSISDGQHLPDEMTGLPTAFMQSGCTSVIGAQWAVPSAAAAHLAAGFYNAWSADDNQSDQALRTATRALRDGSVQSRQQFRRLDSNPKSLTSCFGFTEPTLSSPLMWAAFAHYGPAITLEARSVTEANGDG